MNSEQAFENREICAACGGRCCKTLPGETWPEQWGAPDQDKMIEQLRDAFVARRYAVDWWEGDPDERDECTRGLYIRPAIKGVRCLEHASWGGECVMLRENGCELSAEQRPITCCLLVPNADDTRQCDLRSDDLAVNDEGGKLTAAKKWKPYHDVIERALDLAREIITKENDECQNEQSSSTRSESSFVRATNLLIS